MRITKQKKAILAVMAELKEHVTAEEVYQAVQKTMPHISLATVYRNLERCCHEGSVWKLPGDGLATRYDATRTAHFHARCSTCGLYYDIPHSPALDMLIREKGEVGDFKINGYSLLYMGVCHFCRSTTLNKSHSDDEKMGERRR